MVELLLKVEVKDKQYDDPLLVKLKDGIHKHKTMAFSLGIMMVRQGSTKMYHDLKEFYWWNDIKRDVADFVARCPNCQQLHIKEIVRFHGTPVSIISDRGAQFTAKFWQKFQQDLGTQVNLSTTFHPQIDRQAERNSQTLENMVRACVLDYKGCWDDHLTLIEFAYNNSYHTSIQMAPFEALYGRRCRSPIGWFEVGEVELIGPYLMHQAMEKVKIIKEQLKTTQSARSPIRMCVAWIWSSKRMTGYS
ncbi:uncharacterized protein [Nicotiana tomentosiformis]|uniref:uncharacterized protein n=1 Tax=Nicotiana tomentosiformis TaxID=4098 RepID=UPI00388CC6D0